MKIIKIGGNSIPQLNQAFFSTLKNWTNDGEKILIIHGGGPLINTITSFFNIPTKKIAGIRKTNSQTLQITKATLTEVIQPYLADKLKSAGLDVNLLNGNGEIPLKAKYINQTKYGEVGQVTGIENNKIKKIKPGQVALLTSIGIGPERQFLNINADDVAEKIATITKSDELILLTDVPGIIVNDTVINHLTTTEIKSLINSKKIIGGMIPKVISATNVLKNNVKKVRITNQINDAGTQISI